MHYEQTALLKVTPDLFPIQQVKVLVHQNEAFHTVDYAFQGGYGSEIKVSGLNSKVHLQVWSWSGFSKPEEQILNEFGVNTRLADAATKSTEGGLWLYGRVNEVQLLFASSSNSAGSLTLRLDL